MLMALFYPTLWVFVTFGMPSLMLCFPLARLTYPFKMTFWIICHPWSLAIKCPSLRVNSYLMRSTHPSLVCLKVRVLARMDSLLSVTSSFETSSGLILFRCITSFDSGALPFSQREALISLSFKKGDRFEHKNWRPISLLNDDYK